MQYRFSKRLSLFFAFLCLRISTLESQAVFTIPDEIHDFSSYVFPLHCSAMAGRLNSHLSSKRDSLYGEQKLRFRMKGIRIVDSFPADVGEPIRRCIEKFNPDNYPLGKNKYGVSYYDDLAMLYLKSRNIKGFFTMVDRMDRSMSDSSEEKRRKFYNSVLTKVAGVRPVNYHLYDSLVYSYFLNESMMHGDDLEIFANRISHLRLMADLRFGVSPNEHYDRLVEIGNLIDSMRLIRFLNEDVSDSVRLTVNRIRSHHEYVLSEIRKQENLDSLKRFGPESYFRGIVKNSTIAGFDTVIEPPIPLGRRVIPLKGLYTFLPSGSYVDSASDIDRKGLNTLTPFPDTARPSLLIFLERKGSSDECGFSGKGRYLGADVCHEMIRYIKFVNDSFPELQVVMVVPTRGHLGMRLASQPKEEAEIIREVFQRFHGLSLNLIVYHTDFYNLPNPDGRRVNLTPEYESFYKSDRNGGLYYGIAKDAMGNSKEPSRMFILGPGGVVVAEGGITGSNHEILVSLLQWYKNSRRTVQK